MSAAVRWQGGQVLANAYCLLAPNPGPMTLDGTNSWVLAVPGGRSALVVDPGPLDEAHLTTLAALATTGGRRVAAVLLTPVDNPALRHAPHPYPRRPPRYSSWARTDSSAAGHSTGSTSAYTRSTTSRAVPAPAATAAATCANRSARCVR